jgi:opacity protein-like surface antigen
MKTILVLLLLVPALSAQDSVKVYMLSRSVGTVIDINERAEFNLFPRITGGFISAFIFQAKDSNYYINYRLTDGTTEYDSIAKYSLGYYYSTAVRVQGTENEERGLRFDYNSPVIEYKDSIITMPFIVQEFVSVKAIPNERLSAASDEIPLRDSEMDIRVFLRPAMEFYIGGGLAYSPGIIKGVKKHLNYYEITSPDAGYSVPLTGYDFSVGTTYNFTSSLIYKRLFSLGVKFTFMPSEDSDEFLEYKSLTVSGAYYFPLYENFKPFISAGVIRSFIKIKKNYNNMIIGYREYQRYIDGKYYDAAETKYLAVVNIEKSTEGFELGYGVLYNFHPSVALNFSVNYKLMKAHKLETSGAMLRSGGLETAITLMIR